MLDAPILNRAQGCMLGQLAGDALGSLVEFQLPGGILRKYPDGVREIADGGMWHTIAGQPTDDSEMALMLARTLAREGTYDQDAARDAYVFWFESGPFDYGNATAAALRDFSPLTDSQANGALMRISPLGIFGANYDAEQVVKWARLDSEITHPNEVCLQANALFAAGISHAIRTGCDAGDLYGYVIDMVTDMPTDPKLLGAVQAAVDAPPTDFICQQGWVLIAFQNALWQLLHAPNLEEGVVDTVMRGGDTDTNAAICGALLGSVYGFEMPSLLSGRSPF